MRILVVGSVLLDIIATYKEDTQRELLDLSGELDAYRIGGTAYNIAHNLKEMGCDVTLFTYLKDKTFSTSFFRKKLEDGGLLSDYVVFRDELPEGAFIAHRRGLGIERAVTSTSIENANIQPDLINRALRNSKLLVLDCSPSPRQLKIFIDAASQKKVGVIVAGTSDSKVAKLLSISFDGGPINALIVNKNEFVALWREADLGNLALSEPASLVAIPAEVLRGLCVRLGTQNIIVTLSEKGMVIVHRDGKTTSFAAHPKDRPIVSTTGAGDALISVVASEFVKHQTFNWQRINGEIKPHILSVLSFKGATKNSEATAEDTEVAPIKSLRDVFQRKLNAREYILFWGAVLSLIGNLAFALKTMLK